MVILDAESQYSCASSQKTGWMVSSDALKEVTLPCGSSLNPCITELKKLFEVSHRFTDARLDWLVKWTGANIFDAAITESVTNFAARLHFLKKVWSDVNFRPFDTIQSSVQYLQLQKDQHFLIRLSTTVPGGITLTFRKDLGSKEIVHTRFAVNILGNITDSHGREHSTVESFANWFSTNKYANQALNKSIPLAGYIQANQL
jgi:hypothetical protein